MSNVAIVTDSTSDLPRDLCEKYKVKVIPLSVAFGEVIYLDDGINISSKEFYSKLREAKTMPRAAQPSPGEFMKAYSNILKNHDSIISIHISKKLSGTTNSAMIAKREFKGKDIEIIDSALVHMSCGFLALKAAELAREGKSKKEILAAIYYLKAKIKSLFVPKTLENLIKGGRMGKAKGLFASILEVKPILTLNNGELILFKKTRKWDQAKNEIISSMREMIKGSKSIIVSIGDADAEEDAEEMTERIKKAFNPVQVIRAKVGIVVGTHLGSGGMGITFYEE